MKRKILPLWIAALFFSLLQSNAQLKLSNYTIDTASVALGLSVPWEILWGKDNHIWFTERNGNINRLNPVTKVKKRIGQITTVEEDGESGLLGMAIHPDFPDSNYIYVVYTYLQNNAMRERIAKLTYSIANESITAQQTLIEGIRGNTTHDGSRLLFGPDKMLYMTTGDSQDQNTPQNTTSLNGKILRMTSSGKIPADNPFNSYVWSIGHRNPQGLAFAPNGNLLSSEHGPSQEDELNLITKGANYGWPNVEGECTSATEITFCEDNDVVEPLISWTPTIATAGMEIYRGAMFPDLEGKMLLTSLKNNLRVLTFNAAYTSISSDLQQLNGLLGRMRDICVDPDGAIYISSSNRDGRGTVRTGDDRILKITNKAITGLNEVNGPDAPVLVPNPGNGQFVVLDRQHRGSSVEVYNALGALLMSKKIQNAAVDLTEVSEGFYFYKIKDAQGTTLTENKLIIK